MRFSGRERRLRGKLRVGEGAGQGRGDAEELQRLLRRRRAGRRAALEAGVGSELSHALRFSPEALAVKPGRHDGWFSTQQRPRPGDPQDRLEPFAVQIERARQSRRLADAAPFEIRADSLQRIDAAAVGDPCVAVDDRHHAKPHIIGRRGFERRRLCGGRSGGGAGRAGWPFIKIDVSARPDELHRRDFEAPREQRQNIDVAAKLARLNEKRAITVGEGDAFDRDARTRKERKARSAARGDVKPRRALELIGDGVDESAGREQPRRNSGGDRR